MKRGIFHISNCICPDCGKSFPIPRKNGAAREKNHIKDLWCPFCKDTKKMLEVRYNDTYKNLCGETFKKSSSFNKGNNNVKEELT